MMRRWRALLLCGALLLGLPGCGGETEAPKADGQRFTDALGREVAVHEPERVLALMGGFAETWQLAGGELAGVTRDAIEDRGLPLPEDVVVVGDYNNPSVESILAMEPDLVLLSSETPAHVALLDILEGAGIPALYFRVNHFQDYQDMLRVCTQITGREDLYRQNGTAVGEEIEALRAESPWEEPPTVLLLITYSGGVAVQDRETMAGRMLAELGCVNLTDLSPSLLRQFSMEHIITSEPDYILVIPMGSDEELARKNLRESLETHPAWNGLEAVQNGRLILLPRELFLYKPNARWAESYRYLLQCLEG